MSRRYQLSLSSLQFYEVIPDIWQLRVPVKSSIPHSNIYLIREHRGWCAFDTGMNSEEVREIWSVLLSGPLADGLTRIMVSHHHPDHLGMAAWLQETTGAPVYIRPDELATARAMRLRNPMDETLARDFFSRNGMTCQDIEQTVRDFMKSFLSCDIPQETRVVDHEQRIQIGRYEFDVLVGGGHSVSQLSLYAPSEGVLISGDQLLERITPNVGLWPFGDAAPLANYFKSLDDLTMREIRLVMPAHFEVYSPNGNRAEALRTHHQLKLSRFLDAIGRGGGTAFELAVEVFGKPDDIANRLLALIETLAHLQWLENNGSIIRRDGLHISQYERNI